MATLDIKLLLLLVTTVTVFFIVATVVYRLYFHPLAKFPGPRLVAATSLPELWWDLIGQGAYLYKIEQMHEKYGPIVRVNPCELSIREPQYYDQLYVTGAVRKTCCWKGNGGMEFKDSHGTTIDHDLHRLRRKPMEPYFSRAGVSRIEPVLQSLVQAMVARLDELRGSGNIVRLDHVFSAFSGDVITAICIGNGEGASLRHPMFDPEWYDLFHESIHLTPLFRAFPSIPRMLISLPKGLLEKTSPALRRLNDWQKRAERHIIEAKATQDLGDSSKTNSRHETLFHQLVSHKSGLPESERRTQRLTTEAQVLLGAGTVTTTRTLTYLAVQIMLENRVRSKLGEELKAAAQNQRPGMMSIAELERLPYLRACVKEGLRLSFGFMVRLPRCSPDVELRYKKWVIPKGTPVGMSAYYMHTDGCVFSEPYVFRPERWLDGQVTPEMHRNYVPFSKGSRACLGSNLAYAELLMITAALFHPKAPEIKLYETNAQDANPARAYLLAMPRISNSGVKVKVK